MLKKLLLTMAILSAANFAVAENAQKIQFHVKQQPLALALNALADQANVQIFYIDELTDGLVANPVDGLYDTEQALSLLLARSGLSYEWSDDSTITVIAGPDGQRQKEGADSSAKVNVIEEIVVTAEKRAESLQDIPIAITALSGSDLQQSGVDGIRNLQQLTPSLQFGESPAAVRVSIRGIGSELSNVGNESGVSISQDGVPFFNPYMYDASFLDVERVEVLRGPQGTISGRNATGGAINIYSRLPTKVVEGGLKATIGNYDRVDTEGYISGPLFGDEVLGRLVFRTERADGWLDNTLLNEELNDKDKVRARASFLTHLSDTVEATLVLEGGVDRSTPAWSVDAGRVRPDRPSTSEANGVAEGMLDVDGLDFQSDHSSSRRVENNKGILKIVWDIGDTASLTSTTGYISHRREDSADGDGTAAGLRQFDIEFNLWQASQELTLAADITERLDVIVGGLYMQAEAQEPISIAGSVFNINPGDILIDTDQDITSYAVYTQWRYRITDDIRIALGGRYTRDKKDYLQENLIRGTPSKSGAGDAWGAFTPRIAVDYSLGENHMFYASASRGFKAGTINTFTGDTTEPEFVWSYEAGVKSGWLDGRLRTAFSGFYMDYENLQQSVVRPSPLTGTPINFVENAGEATISGIEFEFDYQVTEHLRLMAGGTWYEKAVYEDFESIDNIFPELGLQEIDNNQITRVPDWQINVSGEYRIPFHNGWQGVLNTSYRWQDKIFFDIFNREVDVQDSYGVLNFHAALESDDASWRVVAFINNVSDERYFSNLSAGSSFGGASLSATLGSPRMYGVTIEHNF